MGPLVVGPPQARSLNHSFIKKNPTELSTFRLNPAALPADFFDKTPRKPRAPVPAPAPVPVPVPLTAARVRLAVRHVLATKARERGVPRFVLSTAANSERIQNLLRRRSRRARRCVPHGRAASLSLSRLVSRREDALWTFFEKKKHTTPLGELFCQPAPIARTDRRFDFLEIAFRRLVFWNTPDFFRKLRRCSRWRTVRSGVRFARRSRRGGHRPTRSRSFPDSNSSR